MGCSQALTPPVPPQLNGAVVQDVQLRVSIARKQPLLDAATGKSLWGSLGELGGHQGAQGRGGASSAESLPPSCAPTAVKNSAKGSHRDKRAQVVYNEDLFGGQ